MKISTVGRCSLCRRLGELVALNDSLLGGLERLARPCCLVELLEELGSVGRVFGGGETVGDVDEGGRVLGRVDGRFGTSEIKLILILRSALLPDFTLPASILWWQS